MENKKYCAKCNGEFEDGELLGIVDGRPYHCIFEDVNTARGCVDNMPKKAGIYYQGKIYSIFDIAKLKNLNEIKSKKTRHGFGLDGNLDDLLN
jgi:hypothetical protein